MRLPKTSREHPSRVWLLEMGIEPYESAWALQHHFVRARHADAVPDVLMLLQHTPVVTLGRRGRSSNVLAAPEILRGEGISVYRVERGGDVTYHGPGQLVGYPILRLSEYGIGVSDYMHLLEEVIIRALDDLGISARRRHDVIGVWTGTRKIAALGARVERGVTYHGFALNVDPNMKHFDYIIPCGITDGGVTSIVRELGRPVAVSQTVEAIERWFAALFCVQFEPVSENSLESYLSSSAYELDVTAIAAV